jgi:endonuclease III
VQRRQAESKGPPPLVDAVTALERFHGRPKAPPTQDPFELILWENAAYLVDDAVRAKTFEALASQVGTRPRDILGADLGTLVKAIAPGGMRPEMRAEKLVDAAMWADAQERPLAETLRAAAKPEGLKAVRKLLGHFPGMGEPGVDKVLLLSGTLPLLALDSNALRVLVRLGFGVEHKQYARTYREVQTRAAQDLPPNIASVRRASLVLRRHGQTTCRRSVPDCGACPLAPLCPTAQAT